MGWRSALEWGEQKVNPLLLKQNSGLLAYYDNPGLPSPFPSNNSSLINQSKLKQKGLNFNFLFFPFEIPKSSLFCSVAVTCGPHVAGKCAGHKDSDRKDV